MLSDHNSHNASQLHETFMKYLYTPLTFSLALISCHLGAMELPNTDTQWANTPAKDAMARFSREKIVLFNGKEYSATPIQHAYLEFLRETGGKISWKNCGMLGMWGNIGNHDTKTLLFDLMHHTTENCDVLLGFDSKNGISVYKKDSKEISHINGLSMLNFLKTQGIDVSNLLPKPVSQPLVPINKSLNTSGTLGLLAEMRKFIPRWLSHQTPSWLNRTNIAIVCLGGIAGLGLVKVVAPKVKQTLSAITMLQTQMAAVKTLLDHGNFHWNLYRYGATLDAHRKAMQATINPALGILGIRGQ